MENAMWFVKCLIFIAVFTPSAYSECSDRRADCDHFKDYCTVLGHWSKFYCPKTCHLCPKEFPPTKYPAHKGGCGIPDVAATSRIISEKSALRGSWPWTVIVTSEGEPLCNGVLVHPQWVLTTTHNVIHAEFPQLYDLVIGEHNTTRHDGSETVNGVIKIFHHPDFSIRDLTNDLTLMKLRHPVQFNTYVSNVCLPSGDVPAVGTECYLTGWGDFKHSGGMETTQHQGKLKVLATKQCNHLVTGSRKILPLNPDAFLCANDDGQKSGCRSNSGGPFVCRNKSGAWELQGVVSHGTQSYVVMAKVKHFVSWINKTIRME